MGAQGASMRQGVEISYDPLLTFDSRRLFTFVSGTSGRVPLL